MIILILSIPKGGKMSVARITTINFKNKEDADKSIQDYSEKAPNEFPEAEQLLQIRASDTTVMAVSLYADNDAMERASAARSKRMSNNENTFEVVDTKTGDVTLNHKN